MGTGPRGPGPSDGHVANTFMARNTRVDTVLRMEMLRGGGREILISHGVNNIRKRWMNHVRRGKVCGAGQKDAECVTQRAFEKVIKGGAGNQILAKDLYNAIINNAEAWRDVLGGVLEDEGKVRGLKWRDLVKVVWILRDAEVAGMSTSNIDNVAFVESIGDILRVKVENSAIYGDEMPNSKLAVSLVLGCSKLGGVKATKVVQDMLQDLKVDVIGLKMNSFLSVVSALAGSGARMDDVSRILSEKLGEEDFLSVLSPKHFLTMLDDLERIRWIPSPKARGAVVSKALEFLPVVGKKQVVSLVRVCLHPKRHDADILSDISDIVTRKMGICSIRELGLLAKVYALYHSLAPGTETEAVLDRIAVRAVDAIEGSDPKDIVRLIQSYQVAGMKPAALLQVLDIWADKRLASMNVQGIALAMTHFARVGEISDRLLRTASNIVSTKLHDVNAVDASRLIWSFARLEYNPGNPVLERGMSTLVASDTMLTDRETTNLLWGLVRLGRLPDVGEQCEIAAMLYRTPGSLSGQSAALLLWSFASSQEGIQGLNHSKAFRSTMYRLGLEVTRDIAEVDSQSISLTSWSIGVMKIRHAEFVKSLSSAAVIDKLDAFEPQHVSNLLWGLGKCGLLPGDVFLSEVAMILRGNLVLYSPQEIFNIFWSFALLKYRPTDIVEEATRELSIRGSEFQGLEFSGMMWSLSKILEHSNSMNEGSIHLSLLEDLITVAHRELPKHVQSLEASQLAMATFGVGMIASLHGEVDIDAPLIDAIFRRVLILLQNNMISVASLNSILEGVYLFHTSFPPKVNEEIQTQLSYGLLARTSLWELCDLGFYLSQVNMSDRAADVLIHIEHSDIKQGKLTPRGAVMLFCIMDKCKIYPECIVSKATSTLNKLSPKYNFTYKWMRKLAVVRERLPAKMRLRLKMHPQIESRMDKVSAS
eukprot:jgi/Picsp_1/574/NSC_00571-R1_protein